MKICINNENHIELITQIMKLIEDDSFIELLNKSDVDKKEIIRMLKE